MDTLGKTFLGLALLFTIIGCAFLILSHAGIHRLPGDVVFRGRNVTVYVPLGLMILLSVLLTIALNLFRRR
jgi:multisubunit Na+/H+ antiporter MnhG subunit